MDLDIDKNTLTLINYPVFMTLTIEMLLLTKIYHVNYSAVTMKKELVENGGQKHEKIEGTNNSHAFWEVISNVSCCTKCFISNVSCLPF